MSSPSRKKEKWTQLKFSISMKSNLCLVSRKFCNILVIWGTVRLPLMLLMRSGRWRTIWYSEVLSSPGTLRMLLIGFASIHSFRPNWLCLIVEVFETGAKFLEPSSYCIGIDCANTFRTANVFGCFRSVWTRKE